MYIPFQGMVRGNKIMPRDIHGILLLNKPLGITSNAALQKIKRLFNAKKAGHTGSLDPLATGMLPICFGEATKFSQFLLDSDKTYYVVAKLGEQTNTGDREGHVIATLPYNHVTQELVEKTLGRFVGDLQQTPPMFSAVKFEGKPLYELARKSIEVERKLRSITIFSITLEKFENDLLSFQVHCSKGTYVRTLVEDIGNALGCGAHVVELSRITVSPYQNHKMYSLSELETKVSQNEVNGLANYLLPIETSVEMFPAIKLSSAATFYLRTGQSVRAPFLINSPLVRLLSEDAKFLGMGEVMADGRVKPHRLLAGL